MGASKDPGEFIRDHLQERQTEGRDYGPDPRDLRWSTANCTWQDPEQRVMTFYKVSGQKDQQEIASVIIPWERRSEFKPEFSPMVAFNEAGPVGLNIVNNPESVVGYLRHIQGYILTHIVPEFEPYV